MDCPWAVNPCTGVQRLADVWLCLLVRFLVKANARSAQQFASRANEERTNERRDGQPHYVIGHHPSVTDMIKAATATRQLFLLSDFTRKLSLILSLSLSLLWPLDLSFDSSQGKDIPSTTQQPTPHYEEHQDGSPSSGANASKAPLSGRPRKSHVPSPSRPLGLWGETRYAGPRYPIAAPDALWVLVMSVELWSLRRNGAYRRTQLIGRFC